MTIKELVNKIYSRINPGNNPLLTESEVFCMAPWIQLHAQTNGKAAPCCMSSVYDGNEIGDLRENPDLREAWNSANMKQLRLNMLQGKKSTICNHCYSYEKMGKFSERMQYNQDYKKQYWRVKATMQDGTVQSLDVPLIDIRFSNKCNYKCRICDSQFSSLWYDEELKTGKIPKLPSTKEMSVADDAVAFWESYKKFLPGVKRLHFAGGEPLFMDEHYQSLEHLIEIGNTDVVLSYNTNFSVLRYKRYDIVELWNKFKVVDVWASLDMMGEKGDYQRKGQKWEKIEENIRIIQQQCPGVKFGVNITVSILNVLDIPAFYRHLIDNKLATSDRINLYLLFDPSYMNITQLTPALKAEVVRRFDEFDKAYLTTLPDASRARNHIAAVINYMQSENGDQQNEFRKWIAAIDGTRNENFLLLFPELSSLMDDSAITAL